ncbi:class I mannose-6-phosphate isomerase [Pedobacter sp. Leaf170]|uniref:class I mannose-6-phosphate isomerase n=1 Tax=Pedobacter sp. Leaf170 TaxID=2876558 RepID=UPI001E5380C4|nr:class I mannose-6-phosphate isomerase [Pedobacter sp. Leaf170]
MSIEEPMRKTEQEIMPARASQITKPLGYDIYPYYSLGDNKIFNGYSSLCDFIIEQKTVVIDGYVGVYWNKLITALKEDLIDRGYALNLIESKNYLKSQAQLNEMIAPFLGTEGSVWGTKTTLTLADYFNMPALTEIEKSTSADINIITGCGASLSDWKAALIYVDLPKNEIQHRMSAGSICNLGLDLQKEQTEMYKCFYFVDWVVLNNHKKALINDIDIFVDAQWEDSINWAYGKDIRKGLEKMSSSVFRARPWFAPGAWGGQWMKEHMPQLDRNEVNYAWSFELIAPENGIVFESSSFLLEVSFDALMFAQNKNVLGVHAAKFGDEFPIRFDFLDTFDGGNLSIQCHPSLKYIQREFGENITQDETYYILDCKDDAKVYLGFQDNINPTEFRDTLEKSNLYNEEIDIEKYVQVHQAKKHDLFLIPNGTVHSAGAENLVLEISATPYIFTFKMYDWVRLDLNGKPRPINIDHAFKNLDFNRKGATVKQELIIKPSILFEDNDFICYHLPTHKEHFYDVHRLEFEAEVEVETNNVCHVLMLVEGAAITVESADGAIMTFPFAETFVIPAAAGSYKMINKGSERAKVIKAFLK